MFTGIIETTTSLVRYTDEGTNRHFVLANPFPGEISVDQSLAHDGVCLTVVEVTKETYTVTAIKETLERSNLKYWKPGQIINIERALRLSDRLDGHIVQGHVDQTAVVKVKQPLEGSWLFTFEFPEPPRHVLIEKGSVAVNGVSLTVFDIQEKEFSVAIIPYTYEHTNFRYLEPGDTVNIEFDMIGKYVEKLTHNYIK